MKKKGLVIVILLILIAAGAGVYFFVLPKEEPPEARSAYVPGEYFITNVKNSNMLVKTTIVLEVNRAADDKSFHEFLAENNHKIRDAIVFVLREKTAEELQSPDIKAILTDEIVKRINQVLGIDNVKTIYFNDYVVQ